MPDKSGLCKPAIENYRDKININFLDTKFYDGPEQTLIAASLLNDIKCDCVLVLGGDGTNRLVAKKINKIPLVPISTGTNNAFPLMIDPTIAGIAAGFFVNLLKYSPNSWNFTSLEPDNLDMDHLANQVLPSDRRQMSSLHVPYPATRKTDV